MLHIYTFCFSMKINLELWQTRALSNSFEAQTMTRIYRTLRNINTSAVASTGWTRGGYIVLIAIISRKNWKNMSRRDARLAGTRGSRDSAWRVKLARNVTFVAKIVPRGACVRKSGGFTIALLREGRVSTARFRNNRLLEFATVVIIGQ